MEITPQAIHTVYPAALEKKAEARLAPFAEMLSKVTKTKANTIIEPLPATLAPLVKPRSHLSLRSLNPVGEIHKPLPAALERIGNDRVLPFSLGQ